MAAILMLPTAMGSSEVYIHTILAVLETHRSFSVDLPVPAGHDITTL